MEPTIIFLLVIGVACYLDEREFKHYLKTCKEHGIPYTTKGFNHDYRGGYRSYWVLVHCSPELQRELKGRWPTRELQDRYSQLAFNIMKERRSK